MKRRHMLAAVLAASVPRSGRAQSFPERPVHFVVPYQPGGSTDTCAGIIAEKLTSALCQQVVIDNRGGVAGLLGTRVAARARPDGYTIVMAHTGTTSINPTLYAVVNPHGGLTDIVPSHEDRALFIPNGAPAGILPLDQIVTFEYAGPENSLRAAVGWDDETGLGVPDGARFLAALP